MPPNVELVTALAKERPLIILASLHLEPGFDDLYWSLYVQLTAKARIQRVGTAYQLACNLWDQKPKAVLLTDAAAVLIEGYPSSIMIWVMLLEWVHDGGTVICMGRFAHHARHEDLKAFFEVAGLFWEVGDYHRTTVHLNKAHVPEDIQPHLADFYSVKGMFLKGVDRASAWYLPKEDSVNESIGWAKQKVNTENTPVAFQKIGEGYVGFVGDCNVEPESLMAILAMCGLHV